MTTFTDITLVQARTTIPSPSTASSSASATCTTAVPGKYGYVPPDACNAYYNFDPKFAPAVAVAVIFGILTGIHIVQGIVFKKAYTWVLIMGALWETIAFVLHSLGSHDQQNGGYSIGYTILFLLAPLWINAFVYMTFARAVYFFEPDHKVLFVQATSMSKYFVWLDIFTFLIQAAGGIMTAPGSDSGTISIGLKVYLAGVGCQEVCILLFLGLMIAFHRDCLVLDSSAVYASLPDRQFHQTKKRSWRDLLYCLYAVLVLITIRVCYRIAEFANGITPESNEIPFHEVYAYVLDALPMILCLIILAVFHPGRILYGPGSELPKKSRKEKKAEKKAKKDLKRQKRDSKKRKQHIEIVSAMPVAFQQPRDDPHDSRRSLTSRGDDDQ